MTDVPGLRPPGWERSRYGANLVVVNEPGSVEDLALIWNLRAAHGLYAGVPLAVPATTDVATALRVWTAAGRETWAMRLFGFVSGRPWGLLSATIAPGRLARWAEHADGNWAPVDLDLVLHPAERPGRPSTDVVAFRDGRGRIPALAAEDREFLRKRPSQAYACDLRVRVNPVGRRLPPNRALARFLPILFGYRGGGSEHSGGRWDDILDVDWPCGWKVLEAAVRDRGLRAEPSRPGRAATALLRRLGSFAQLQALADPAVLEVLSRLGARSGRAYFEEKVREIHAALDLAGEDGAARSEAIEAKLADLALAPFESDKAEVTWDELKQILSRDAAHE